MNATPWRIVLAIGSVLLAVAGGCALGWRCLSRSEDPAKLAFKWILSLGLVLGALWILPGFPTWIWPALVVPFGIVMGIVWAPSIGAMLASPVTDAIDGGDVPVDAQPFYSVAEAKRRNGHPEAAAAAVREELAKFPDDFRGVMLLASILAEELQDLPGAQLALEDWMARPAATPQGKASALTALADWQLQFARDPAAARVALERIVQEFPDTQVAHQAAQRLAHLPTAEFLAAAGTCAALDLPPGAKDIGLRREFAMSAGPSRESAALAEEYVKQLTMYPADTATREKLAVLYAEKFQRLDLAVDQLEQLIALPHETPRHIVEWLNLLADLQIRCGQDLAGAEATLRRVVERFSTPALVEPTLARLAALEGEMKLLRVTPLKRLGQYEKYIGLKKTATRE